VHARQRRPSSASATGEVVVPPIGFAAPSLTLVTLPDPVCASTFARQADRTVVSSRVSAFPTATHAALPRTLQAPDHGHSGVTNHPERLVHLSGLMKVDIGQFPKHRSPLIAGWLSELGFKLSYNDVRPILGGPRKQKQSSAADDDAKVKRKLTGRYLVTLATTAEAERLAREIHGRKYSVSSKLVRRSIPPSTSPRSLVPRWSACVGVFAWVCSGSQVRRCKFRPVSWGKAANQTLTSIPQGSCIALGAITGC
jgi:hypothetical protein